VDLVDAHLHLDDPVFDADRDDVVRRARATGVTSMLTVGTNLATSRAAVALAERYPEVYAAVAVHPHEAAGLTDDILGELRALAGHRKVVAIGETGLDFARGDPPRDVQETAFRRHIGLSAETGLPLAIHCRDAFGAVFGILLEDGSSPGVIMHAFSGTVENARTCLERGYAVSLAGPVTFRDAHLAVEVARMVPLHAMLVETDAPVLAPVPFRGRRNEPAFLPYTVERIAAVKAMPVDDVAAATTANARHVFRMDLT
jgi:TatD DNase family protein